MYDIMEYHHGRVVVKSEHLWTHGVSSGIHFVFHIPPQACSAARFGGGGLGLNWVCFHQVSDRLYFHNSLYYVYLHSFEHPGNWVCFA